MMSNSAYVFEPSDGGVQSYKTVDKRLHYVQNYISVSVVSLPVFGGNFVLAKRLISEAKIHSCRSPN